MTEQRVSVPNIGDASDVAVVEILVQPGARVEQDQALVVLESDKASMEIPSPSAGVVKSIAVKVGDPVSEGSPLVVLETNGAGDAKPAPKPTAEKAAKAEAPSPKPPEKAKAAAGQPPAEPSAEAAATPKPEAPAPAAAEEPGSDSVEAQAPSEQWIRVPNIGDASDVAVVEVLVQPGARVEKDQALVVLESDKASMEIPSPSAGVVKSISVKVGDPVSEGSPLLALETEGAGDAKPAKPPKQAPPKQAPSAEGQARQAPPPETPAPQPQRTAPAAVGEPRSEEVETQARTFPPAAHEPEPTRHAGKRSGLPHASPAIRRFARELGVDLARIEGSGKHGRITKDDLQRFVKQALTRGAGAGVGLSVAEAPEIDFTKFGPIESQALTKIQRVSGKNLHRSWVTIPHVTQFDDADITELEAFRKKLKAEQPKLKLTLLCFFMKAVVSALKAMPRFNSSLDKSGDNLIVKGYYHIGVAVDTPNGLVVPAIRDVDQKSLSQLAKELEDVSERARSRKLMPNDLQGASFTISSLGGIGGTKFTPIINPPEVAVLGVSRAQISPIYEDGKFVPRLICPLSLSYDHRVIDGADAARFTRRLCELLSDIRQLLL